MDRTSQIEAAIAAQEQLRDTLGDQIVDAAIAALRASLDAPDQPQRKLATVLFADIAGFTQWSEGADAEDVGTTVGAVWDRLDAIVTAHNGRVDKHIGDALMAVWGATAAREDDPENAIRAALELTSAFSEIAASGERAGSPLGLRTGVNTGPVILRRVGTGGEFTALGDAVNVAARLESAAPVGGVLVGHDTYRHVRGLFTASEQPPLQVKGKRGTLRTYLVTAVRPRAFRLETRGVEGIETPMVGRDDELEQLRRLFADATATKAARLATVVGEAGLGKSRLLYEYLDWLQLQPEEIFIFMGRSDARHEGVPYALLRDLMFVRFGISDDHSTTEAVALLVAGFDSLGGLPEEAAHRAAHLIGLDMGTSPHVAGLLADPQQLRVRGESAVIALVLAMAATSPVLMAIEDIHWADRASLELIERIVNEAAVLPLVVVAAARPLLYERLPQWGGLRIVLAELVPQATESLVAEVLHLLGDVPPDLLRSISDAAAGNPFYVEELVKSLIETGTIEVTPDGWAVAGTDAVIATPPTLTALLQARLDRLDPAARRALQQAAVVGSVFWDEALAAIQAASANDRADLEAVLAELTERELVLRHHESSFHDSLEYGFKHALLRDVTYESVLKADRRPYHNAVATWLAAKPDSEARAAVIAGHYEEAESPDAARWHVRAGTQARLRFANDEALAAYQRALELGGLDDDSYFEALDGSGDVFRLQARYREAVAAHERMLHAARVSGDPRAQARALTGMVFAGSRIGSPMHQQALAEEAIEIVQGMPAPDHKLLSEALRAAGWIALQAGDPAAANQRATDAVKAADAATDRRGRSLALNLLSLAESGSGDFVAADAHLLEALEIDRALGDRQLEGSSLINLGESARIRGEYAAAAAHYTAALAIHRELGDHDLEALALSNLGGVSVGLGRFEEATRLLFQARDAFQEAGRLEYLSETERFLAEAHLGLKADDGALEHAQRALEAATSTGSPEQIGQAWRVLGCIAAGRGGEVSAGVGGEMTLDDCFAKSLEYLDTDTERARTLADWARAVFSTDAGRADQLWEQAMAILVPLALEHLAGELA